MRKEQALLTSRDVDTRDKETKADLSPAPQYAGVASAPNSAFFVSLRSACFVCVRAHALNSCKPIVSSCISRWDLQTQLTWKHPSSPQDAHKYRAAVFVLR